MFHKTLAVKATTTTDQGEFTAIAAAYSVDRTNERIIPGAFGKSIDQWQASGKQIPLHWDHSSAPQDIIGTIDPASMRETDAGLQVKGQLDLEGSDVAKEAWRLMRKSAVAFSFGYLVTDSAEAKDGVLDLKALDLFEISVTPAPVNPDTRILSMKAMSGNVLRMLESMVGQAKEFIATEPDPEDVDAMEDILESLEGLVSEETAEGDEEMPAKSLTDETTSTQKAVRIEDAPRKDPKKGEPKAQDPLRRKAEETALQVAAGHLEPTSPPPAKKHRRSPGGVRRDEADRMVNLLSGKEPDDEPAPAP